jgi:hypothetical protein
MTVVADQLIPIVCRILARRMLDAHKSCIDWSDEARHECSHLQDIQIVFAFADEWRQSATLPIHDHAP